MVCTACATIFEGDLPPLLVPPRNMLEANRDVLETMRRKADKPQPLHGDISELCRGALDGCHICDIVWRHFFRDKTPQEYLSSPWFVRDSKVHAYMGSGTHYRLREHDTSLGHTVSEGTLELQVGLNSPLDKHVTEVKSIIVAPLDDEIYGSLRSVPLPDLDIYSGNTWTTIQNWLTKCKQDHVNCNGGSSVPSWYPTRLLKIQTEYTEDSAEDSVLLLAQLLKGVTNPIDVQLIETALDPPTGPYMTLSHRWNSSITIKAEKSNINQLKSRFPAHWLSPTFLQAIMLAARLGVRYLWIDSLCIIQDDENDWTHEALTMGQVYSHGLLNLSATAAGSGLFPPRNPRLIKPCIVQPQWTGVTGPRSRPHAIMDSQFWGDRIHRSVCNQRGWIIQERWLAPRVLHFTFDQLIWECREVEAAETFPHGLPKELQRYVGRHFKQQETRLSPGEGTATPESLRRRDWRNVLVTYSRAELTRETDRLIAIAGVAERFAEILNDEWIAGLWRRALPGDLLWHVNKGRRTNKPPSGMGYIELFRRGGSQFSSQPSLSSRLESYQAPSWSWASVHGDIEPDNFVPQDSEDAMVTVVDVSVTPLDLQRPRGRIKDAHLRLRGTLYPLAMDPPDWYQQYEEELQQKSGMPPLPPAIYLTGLGMKKVSLFGKDLEREAHSHEVGFSLRPDEPVDYSDVAKSCYLPVAKLVYDNPRSEYHARHMVKGLCLMPTGRRQGEYRRLGRADFGGEACGLFEDGLEVQRGNGEAKGLRAHPPTLDSGLYEEGNLGIFCIV